MSEIENAAYAGATAASRHWAGTGFWSAERRGNPHTDRADLARAWDQGYHTYERAAGSVKSVTGDGQIIDQPALRPVRTSEIASHLGCRLAEQSHTDERPVLTLLGLFEHYGVVSDKLRALAEMSWALSREDRAFDSEGQMVGRAITTILTENIGPVVVISGPAFDVNPPRG